MERNPLCEHNERHSSPALRTEIPVGRFGCERNLGRVVGNPTMTESERPLPPPPSLPATTPYSVSGPPPQPPVGSSPSQSGQTPGSGAVAASTGSMPSTSIRAPNGRRAAHLTIPPPREDGADDDDGVRTEADFKPERALEDQISELESWARAIERLDRRELFRFWFLRGLGFVSAAGAVAGGAIRLADLALIAGAVAASAIAIEAAWPTSADRSARRRAIHDLRELQHTLKLKWDKVRLAYPKSQTARRIAHALTLLDMAQAKREEVGKFLGEAAPRAERRLDDDPGDS